MKPLLSMLFKTIKAWQQDNISVWSAALSYYTVFSLAPILVLIVSISGLFLGKEAIEGNLVKQISGLLGPSTAQTIQQMIANSSKLSTNIITSIVSIITIIFGATGIFSQLQEAMNAIFKVKKKSNTGIKKVVRDRILNFSIIAGISFLLLVSLAMSTAISAISTMLEAFIPQGLLLELINVIISVGIITIMFTIIFTIIPDVKIPLRVAWRGALVTGTLFTLGKSLIGIYIGNSSLSSTYGAAASVAVILLWVFYAAHIMFFGAEFMKVYAKHHNILLTPDPDMEKTTSSHIDQISTTISQKKAAILSAFFRGLLSNLGGRRG